jgi:HAD superfamily hydrolase (TIGR01509 family)
MNDRKPMSAVIFDCDGVLFDSRRSNIHFYNHLLRQFGLPPMEEDQVAYVHMHTVDEAVRLLFRGSPHEEAAQAYRKKLDYTPFIRDMVPEPGLKDVLQKLRPRFGLAVATNRSTTIRQVLQAHGISDYFDMVVSSLDVEKPKPHPESLLRILHFFGIGPQDAFYIGDSVLDSQTARAAGVPFISYKDNQLDADHQVDSLAQILDVVE